MVAGRLLIALLLAGQAESPSVIRLYPIDETTRDPGFHSFVGKLRSAVESRKTDALKKLVDKEVFVGPGDDDKGWKKFIARWRPDDREDQRLWTALADLLSLGFVREHPRLFLSPYLVWRFPRELNAATHLVIVRDKAALREAPSPGAPVAVWLSFDIVRRLGRSEQGDGLNQWVRVETLDGTPGYVNARDVMSPTMPRAQFGLNGGRWFLKALERQGP